MYEDWLKVFFSSETEIPIKGQNQKQPIHKEWVGNNMKISGNKPSNWSITLIPAETLNMLKYRYDALLGQENSIEKMKDAFIKRNKEMFEKGVKKYEEDKKREKIIDENMKKFEEKKIETMERLFQAKRNLFLLNRQRKIKKLSKDDIILLNKINQEIKNILNEQIIQNNEIKFKINYFSPSKESVKSEGPVPEPPKIKPFIFSKITRISSNIKKQIQKEKEKVIKDMNSDVENINDSESDSESSEFKDMSGGIKIIKL